MNSTSVFHFIHELAQGNSITIVDMPAKTLEEIKALNIDLELDGNNYCLKDAPEFLKEELIRQYTGSVLSKHITSIETHWTIDSTNDYLLTRMAKEDCQGVICLAEQQTAGKGRRGRSWISPFATNLYMSIGWKLPKSTREVSSLSLVVGIVVAEVLRELGLKNIRLKWPNDLLLGGRKLGGILIEMVASASTYGLVIGIGINFESSLSQLKQVEQPVGFIPFECGFGRNQLAGCIIQKLLPDLCAFRKTGFTTYRKRWESLNLYQDKMVDIHLGDKIITGLDRGIDNEGNLILEKDGNLLNFNAGEVSLRPAD